MVIKSFDMVGHLAWDNVMVLRFILCDGLVIIGEMQMIKILKDKEILKKKPNLKLMPNHYHFISGYGRTWNSSVRGTAQKVGNWYKERVKND